MARHQEQTPIVIPMEDDTLHTQSHPLCSDPTCPRKEASELLAAVALPWKIACRQPRNQPTWLKARPSSVHMGAGWTIGCSLHTVCHPLS